VKITSWNVNGIRATVRKKAFGWLKAHNADVIGLQEIKAKEDQVDTELVKSMGYEYSINSAERPGYSGVLMMYKIAPDKISFGLGEEKFDIEGREALLEKCDELVESGREIILTGDFNTAHKEIDLKNPSSNKKNTGFLPEERVWIDRYIEHGFHDVFRELYPDKEEYTWWTYRFNARENNVGWRIDYFMVTKGILEKTEKMIHHTDIMGSDHCPLSLIIN